MTANQTVTRYGVTTPRFMEQMPKSTRTVVHGLEFPLGSRREIGGFFCKNSGVGMIKDAVKQLLLTERGERVMLPAYGCNLRRFLFQPLDDILFENIKREITTSFSRFIVGANIKKLGVFPLGDIGPSCGNSLKVILSLEMNTQDLEVFDVEVVLS